MTKRTLVGIAAVAIALPACAGATATSGDGHGAHGGDSDVVDGAREVAVEASSFRFEPSSLELEAGEPVNIALTSTDTTHDLVVREVSFHVAADPGETAVGGLTIEEPGTYEAYCSVPGHRQAGMRFAITVR